jgi:hypothetical protein
VDPALEINDRFQDFRGRVCVSADEVVEVQARLVGFVPRSRWPCRYRSCRTVLWRIAEGSSGFRAGTLPELVPSLRIRRSRV